MTVTADPDSMGTTGSTTSDRGRRGWTVGTAVLLGTLVLQLGWLLSVPPFAGIDEIDHVFRASSVGSGHVRPDYVPVRSIDPTGRGDLIPVRADVARAAQAPCRAVRYNSESNCTPTRVLAHGQVLIGSSAARYDPAFYLATGYLSRPFRGDHAVYAMRITGAAMSALLLAWTAGLLASRSRTAWPLLVLLVSATPIVVYSTTVASPNGLHTASAIALWVSVLGLFGGDRPGAVDRRRLLGLGTLSASVLLLTHSLAGLWLALIALTVLALAGPGSVAERVRGAVRQHLLAGAVVALVFVASVGWIALARTNDPGAEPVVNTRSPVEAIVGGLVLWPLQAVAAFPSREQVASPVVYVIVLTLVLAFSAIALVRADRRTRAIVAVMVGVSYVVPIVLTAATYSRLGAAWQGRYVIPYAVGALLILAQVLDRTWVGSLPIPVVVGVSAMLVTAQLFSWTSVVHTVLHKQLWQTTDRWGPPSVVVLVVLACLAGALWSRALIAVGGRDVA